MHKCHKCNRTTHTHEFCYATTYIYENCVKCLYCSRCIHSGHTQKKCSSRNIECDMCAKYNKSSNQKHLQEIRRLESKILAMPRGIDTKMIFDFKENLKETKTKLMKEFKKQLTETKTKLMNEFKKQLKETKKEDESEFILL